MKTTFKTLVGALVLALVGCGGGLVDDLDTTGMTADEITNGKVDTGHPAVGKVTQYGDGICTGTLIGKKTVLTAAHCIEGAASSYGFVLGSASYAAASITVHPGWNGNYNGGEGINDLAVIILKTAPSVTPMPIAATAPVVGQKLTLVGFGSTSENVSNYGTKRIAYNVISDIGSTNIYWDPSAGTYKGQSTCYGDSGGPAFATIGGQEVQVGITSGGSEPCATGYSWDTNVFLFKAWILQVANNDVVVAGGTTCTPACSGKTCGSDGCGGTCGTCSSGQTCNTSGQCVTSGGTTTTCSHAICSTGAKLVSTCDSCVAKVCAQDSYCCNNSWDATCVKEVGTICGQTCGGTTCTPSCSGKTCGSDGCGGTCGTCASGSTCNTSGQCVAPASTCSHNICSKGTKLTSSCDPCVKAICAQDSYCCNNSWDATCVKEVATICGKSC